MTVFRRVFSAVLVGLALVVLLFLSQHQYAGGGRFIHVAWARNLLFMVPSLLLLVALGKGRGTARPRIERREVAPALALLGCLVLFLFSGAVKHPWFYLLNWYPRPDQGLEGLDIGMVRFVLLAALLMPFMLDHRPKVRWAVGGILVLVQLACLVTLLRTTGGQAIYRDDHPSFMFRLWEFGATFPRLVTYNPYWNGGVVNFVGTTSGTAAIGLPLFPLWRFFPAHVVYTLGVGLIYIVVMPWIAVASLRIMGANRTAAYCAGLLALGVSRHFFLWMLHYGTVGAAFASSFILPVSACVYRIVWLRKREKWLFAATVAGVFFLLQWPPGALMLLPLGISMLFSTRRWTLRTWGVLCGVGVAVLVLDLRPLLTIVSQGDSLMAHVMDAPRQDSGCPLTFEVLKQGFTALTAHAIEGHPLLIFLGLGGMFVLPSRSLRRWYAPLLLSLAFLAGWGPHLKPNLQLSRMAIPMFFAAVPCASILVSRLLETGGRRLAPVRAMVLAVLILGGWSVARLYAGKGHAPYTVPPDDLKSLVEWLRNDTPPGGRIMFAGRCVHYYGRGHVAYLPRLVGREMMACDYYAFPTTTVEYNYPPRPFRQSKARLFEFMELYNVTHVITYHDSWKEAFRRNADKYEEVSVPAGERTALFRVRRKPSLFLRGTGTAEAAFNRIHVELDDPREEVVIKYNWADRLQAPPPVEIAPWDAGGGVQLIAIRPNGAREFTLRFGGWL